MRNFAPSYSNLLSIILGLLFWLAGALSFAQTSERWQKKQQVYAFINAERETRGLPAIPVDKKLERSAQSWSVFMPYRLVHNVNFLKRFHRTGSECLTVGGDPVASWLKSKPHRQCILGKGVTAMGVGYWRGKWIFRTFTN
jgi:uncharacterized protein YkwD